MNAVNLIDQTIEYLKEAMAINPRVWSKLELINALINLLR